MDIREYVCNQMYKQRDLLRKGSWTDADKLEYMELSIAPYSRCWRMGMKKALKHAIRLLREEGEKADRKTEHMMTKEIHDINTKALDFVVGLIEYIFEYPDDDYMTMECLCRELHKYGLINEKDGEWTTNFIERKESE